MAKEKRMLLIQSAVRETIGEDKDGLRVSGEFLDAFNEKVHAEIEACIRRTKANGKKTVGPESI